MVRAFTSHKCGQSSNPGINVIRKVELVVGDQAMRVDSSGVMIN